RNADTGLRGPVRLCPDNEHEGSLMTVPKGKRTGRRRKTGEVFPSAAPSPEYIEEARRRYDERERQRRLEIEQRCQEEAQRIARGDIPDLVPPLPGETVATPWVERQPLSVAGRPDREDLPWRIFLVLLQMFKIHTPFDELQNAFHRWASLCDPPWPR